MSQYHHCRAFFKVMLEQHSLAMLKQYCNLSKQCRNNVATMCCAKNRLRELSRVASGKNTLFLK